MSDKSSNNPPGQKIVVSNSKFDGCTNTYIQNISTDSRPPDHIKFQVPDVPAIYRTRDRQDSEMNNIRAALVPDETTNEQARVLLTGQSGYGKSWLMAKYIAVHHDQYDRNFIWFSSGSSIETNVRQLAVELRMPSSELRNFDHILADVLQYLKDRKALVVLQHLKDDNLLFKLKRILYQCPKLSILAIEEGPTNKYPPSERWNRVMITDHYDPELHLECLQDRLISLFDD